MANVHVFTSAAGNYLPKVRVLFETVRAHHPDWTCHLALADAPQAADALAPAAPDEVHLIPDLEVPRWKAWAFSHSLMELATAIKPLLLRKLLARADCDAAIYLDPDVAVFSPLDDVVAALDRADLLLTPHQTEPETTLHGVIANEICTLQHGVYNLGFVGVAARDQGRAFADWWARRCYQFCRADIPNGVFTDQRWIDLAPGFFDRTEILRAPRLNVAPWNLSTRRLAGRAPDALTVDGCPLGFFHFSAIDAAGDGFAADDTAAHALGDWYRRETRPRQGEPGAASAWAFAAFADGTPIAPEQRWLYRLRGDLQDAYPDPFASGPDTFQAWWAAQAPLEQAALFDLATQRAAAAHLASALTTGYAPLAW